MTAPLLQWVAITAKKRAAAERDYRAALLDAQSCGHSYREIAKAAGVDVAAVHRMLARHAGS